MKKILLLIGMLCLVFTISCDTADILTGDKELDRDWSLVIESGEDSTVRLYVTKQDEKLRTWLNDYLQPKILTDYKLTLELKIVDFQDLLAILETERNEAIVPGEVDLMLLWGDEFEILKSKGLLYEDIATKIPNNNDWLNAFDQDISMVQGTAIDGYALPFGRNQMVMVYDEDILEIYPRDTEELLRFLKENPSRFTYANPVNDETGAAFVRSIIYDLVSEDHMKLLYDETLTEADVESIIMPGINYLKLLDGYVYKENGRYISRQSDVDVLFQTGQVYFSMTKDFAYIDEAIDKDVYPYGAVSFVLDGGSIGSSNYLALPENGFNKSGALLLINEMMSQEVQVHKYLPSNFGDLPIYDLNLLPQEVLETFQEASLKRGTLTAEILLNARYPELPVRVQEMINQIWLRHMSEPK